MTRRGLLCLLLETMPLINASQRAALMIRGLWSSIRQGVFAGPKSLDAPEPTGFTDRCFATTATGT